MKIIVFGATGSIGRQVVRQALEHGHEVTAFTRDSSRVDQRRRLICQTTIGTGDSRGNLSFFWKYLMFGGLLRRAYGDHQEQEQHVTGSDLDWTIVRPGAFTDGGHTGRYRHGFPGDDRTIKLKISRADVADPPLLPPHQLPALPLEPRESFPQFRAPFAADERVCRLMGQARSWQPMVGRSCLTSSRRLGVAGAGESVLHAGRAGSRARRPG